MNESSLEQAMDRYVSGEASEAEAEDLAVLLEQQPDEIASLVKAARLEALLRSQSEETTTFFPSRRRTSILAAAAAAAAVALGIACWWAFSEKEIAPAPTVMAAHEMTVLKETDARPRSILPKRAQRRSDFSPQQIQRLERYLLPTMDLRGRSVAQAVGEIDRTVKSVGFDESAAPMPEIAMVMSGDDTTTDTAISLEVDLIDAEGIVSSDSDTIDLELLAEVTEFEGFVNYGSAIALAGSVPLHRENLPLLPTLRYLAALDGKQIAFRGTSIILEPESTRQEGLSQKTLRVPPDFLQPDTAPHFLTSSDTDDEEEPFPDADLTKRLRAWGLSMSEGDAEASHDPSKSNITLTSTESDHRILKSALALINAFRIVRQVEIEVRVLEFTEDLSDLSSDLERMLSAEDSTSLSREQIKTLAKTSPYESSLTFPKVVTRASHAAHVRSITDYPEEEGETLSATSFEEPIEEPWSGSSLRVLPSLVGEQIHLDLKWDLRGELLGVTEDGEFHYDGHLRREVHGSIPHGHAKAFGGDYETEQGTSKVLVMVLADVITPHGKPLRR